MTKNGLNNFTLNLTYDNWDGIATEENIRISPHAYPSNKWGVSVSDSCKISAVDYMDDHISRQLTKFVEAAVKNAVETGTETNKTSNTETKKEKNKMSNTIKNVLFLAPGYQYALTVIANQSKELDRKKITYNTSKDAKNLYISTDKVHVEIVYMDPVKYTPDLFQKRDAVFGKKELLDNACETFFSYIIAPKKSLSKYICELHNDPNTTAPAKPRETYIPEIKNAYFNNPMTVVMWDDGTKTIVECQSGDVYSAETGLALCIAKKALGNMPNFNNIFKKWIPEEKKETDHD